MKNIVMILLLLTPVICHSQSQKEQLQMKVVKLIDENAEINAKNSELAKLIYEKDEQISGLKHQIDTLTQRINELNNKISGYQQVKNSKSPLPDSNATPSSASNNVTNKPVSQSSKSTSSYSNSETTRIIHTGPRGGRYYINKNGNKTYIKK